jgi:hypothetical protein
MCFNDLFDWLNFIRECTWRKTMALWCRYRETPRKVLAITIMKRLQYKKTRASSTLEGSRGKHLSRPWRLSWRTPKLGARAKPLKPTATRASWHAKTPKLPIERSNQWASRSARLESLNIPTRPKALDNLSSQSAREKALLMKVKQSVT